MSRLRSPILWYGGKGNMVAKLLPYISIKHQTYVEPYGGGASMLMAKEPSPVEVYNDLDSGLVGFFRVLRDKEKFSEFHRLVSLMPCSREEYYYCRDNWQNETDEIKRAAMWFAIAKTSFSGMFGGSWHLSVTNSRRNMSSNVSQYLSSIALLPAVSDRLLQVQIENKDALGIIRQYDRPETLFYCDPPYVMSTRKMSQYAHEMTDEQHEELLTAINKIDGMCLLSGYPNEMYSEALAGWHRREFQTACSAAGKTRATGIQGKGSALKKQPRTEVIWWNDALNREFYFQAAKCQAIDFLRKMNPQKPESED